MNYDDLVEILERLDDAWSDAVETDEMHQLRARRGKSFTGTDVARLGTVLALTKYAYENARAVRLLLDNGMVTQAIPLTRFVFECTYTAALLVHSKGDHGIRSILQKYTRGRKVLKDEAENSESPAFRRGAADIADTDGTGFEGSWDDLKRFDSICADLTPGGADAYILFRGLSSFSHASIDVTNLYFEENGDAHSFPFLRSSPRSPYPKDLLLSIVARMLVWNGRTLNYYIRDNRYRNLLRHFARELGCPEELKLSEAYHARHAGRGRAKREATARQKQD